jgi:heme/copper-type cytochrome/quinol oxidase subunit 3
MSEIGGEVTRSVAADTAAAAAAVDRRRQSQPSGWWGMVLFLCSEVTLFGMILATYFYLDFSEGKWPPAGIKPPSIVLPLVATGFLVLTSIPMWSSVRAARAGIRGGVIAALALALVMQCVYLAAQILLFRHDLLDFSPQATAYGSIYFTMLAAHHAHVLLGILLNAVVLWKVITRGLNNYWLIGVRGVGLYWHVVNVVAIFVVFTQLSPSL